MLNRRRISTSVSARRPLIFGAVAALLAAPLVAIGGNATIDMVEGEGTGPVNAMVNEMPLSDGASVLVDDAAIATQSVADDLHPNRGVVKELRRDEEFSMFALTWTGSADVASFFRAQREDGSWSEWYAAEPQYPAGDQGNGLNGTELIYVEPTKAVQVSTHGLDVFGQAAADEAKNIKGIEDLDKDQADALIKSLTNAAATASESVNSALNDVASNAASNADAADDAEARSEAGTGAAPEADTADRADKPATTKTDKPKVSLDDWANIEPVVDEKPMEQVNAVFIDGNAPAGGIDPIVDAKNATGMPKVITRAGWGADESKRCQGASYDAKLKGTTVHHTAGSNNYSEAQAAGIVRGIYAYHGQTLGWCDVGYNALVDKYGNIYEGRYGGLDKNVQGAHAGGFNQGTFGISMMGDYSSVQPSQAMINSVGNMIGWRMKVGGVDPTSKIQLTSSGFSGAKYAAGQTANLPAIFAHRDTGYTTCPGDAGFAQMGNIRSIAKKKYDTLTSGKVDNEGKEGSPDLVVDKDGSTTSSSAAPSTTSSSKTTSSKATSSKTTSSSAAPSKSTSSKATTSTESAASSTSKKSESTSSKAAESTSSSASAVPSSTQTDEPTELPGTEPTEPTAPAEPGTDGTADDATAGSPQLTEQDKANAAQAITGARSMLASALGLLGAPGLAQSADAILESVGMSIQNGPSVDDLPILVEKLLDINEKNNLAEEWNRIVAAYGQDALGQVESGVQTGATLPTDSGNTDTLSYVKFDKGLITSSPETGTNAIWGEVAEAWANQGFEIGELGAPVASQTIEGDIATAEFQNGTITWNTKTGKVDVQKR
ncbi:N-acetylmuramoyl-L-alanine amidase [Corynebacterium sp. H78]|uniref:N-acetylmuramoyl-L-alanine amidase n=1 Tax=Corynebacterium sp. H78 TaxID=3133417 RepID=UPI0030B7BA18